MAAASDGLTIGQVSDLLRVPVPTLRSWHERYGVAVPARTSGGHRRYGVADVEVLQAMRAAVGRGLSASSAAQALRAPRTPSDVPLSLLSVLLERVAAYDQEGVVDLLDRAEREIGLDRTVDRLLLPGLQEIGDRWERAELDVGAEHAATTVARQWIARRTWTTGTRRAAPPVLLAAAPGNRHTVALEAFGLLLHARGWPSRLLGADTPVAALLRAVEATDAQAVVVTAQQVSRRRAAVAALEALQSWSGQSWSGQSWSGQSWSGQSRRLRLWYAGAAFDSARHRRGVLGGYLGTALPEAADAVAAELRPG